MMMAPEAMSNADPTTLRYAERSKVVPGDRLGTIRHFVAGPGTYLKGGHIFASIVGQLELTRHEDKYRIDVHSTKPITSNQVLRVGSPVIGQVIRITSQQATVEILAMDSGMDSKQPNESVTMLSHPAEGIIRREDIRSGASEQVKIHESFLPGDLVVCRMISMGDARRYGLTTASPELGVIYACSAVCGKPMTPCSWKEMICPESAKKERRKCARPRAIIDPSLKEI
jgi:exosome complex component CSL4